MFDCSKKVDYAATSQVMWVLVWDSWFSMVGVKMSVLYVVGCTRVCWVLDIDGTLL